MLRRRVENRSRDFAKDLSSGFMSLDSLAKGIAAVLITELFIAPTIRVFEFPFRDMRGFSKAELHWRGYLLRARARLSKAYSLISKGLEDEAGEEAWRAAVDAVKAISALLWGLDPQSHQTIGKVVEELCKRGIVDITTEYGNAQALHRNYYEPYMGPVTVRSNIRQVERLIRKVESAVETYSVYASLANTVAKWVTEIVENTAKAVCSIPIGIKPLFTQAATLSKSISRDHENRVVNSLESSKGPTLTP